MLRYQKTQMLHFKPYVGVVFEPNEYHSIINTERTDLTPVFIEHEGLYILSDLLFLKGFLNELRAHRKKKKRSSFKYLGWQSKRKFTHIFGDGVTG